MKKFMYRMQGILDIKYKVEDQERANFGVAMARLVEQERILGELEVKKEYFQDTLRQMVVDSLKIREIMTNQEAVEIMKDLIKTQMARVRREEHQVEIARQRLNNAMIERKTQEKLRENAFEEYKFEFNSEERKEIDELVSYKHGPRLEGFV